MKVLTSFSRILVGLLFMFSGLIKSNDPKGTGIKMNEYFDVFASSFIIAEDTLKVAVSDDLGTNELYEFTITHSDSNKRIQFNQSALRKEYFEGDEDSTLGSEVFLLLNGNVLYNAFYELGENKENPKINIHVTAGKGKVILDKTIEPDLKSKVEFDQQVSLASYVKKESFWVGFFRGMKPYSLTIAMIMCILEVVLGFAILIGWLPRINSWLILLLILFFTFLTWYSAYYNKVTDCGCFGDFIKLKPWHSFIKDLILLVFILVIFLRRKTIVPLFSPLFSINAMIVVLLSSSVFTVYCNTFLPAKDFLPYKAGNNVREMLKVPMGKSAVDKFESLLVYAQGDKLDTFIFPAMPKDSTWKYVSTIQKIVVPAWHSEIHDFNFVIREDVGIDVRDTLLLSKRCNILIVCAHLENAHKGSWEYIRNLAKEALKNNIGVYAVTASSLDYADIFTSENQLPFRFSNADETLLKTIVRSNPGVMLWQDGVIVDKWSCRSIPSIDKIKKIRDKR